MHHTDTYCPFASMQQHIHHSIMELYPQTPPKLLQRIDVTPPKDPKFGHMASNAAMILSKQERLAPEKIAQNIIQHIIQHPNIHVANIAKPGFINIFLTPSALQQTINTVLCMGNAYGTHQVGNNIRVNVEYVSANPTGPLHVGHCRGAVVGDVLATLLQQVGYNVTREYYINDAGTQITALAWAAYWRYLQAIGTHIEPLAFNAYTPNGLQYQGDYLIPVGKILAKTYGNTLADANGNVAPKEQWFDVVRNTTIECMMNLIRKDLTRLGINHDVFSSEYNILTNGSVQQAINKLHDAGLIYEGILPPPKGKEDPSWEPRPQTLFRATQFGDDQDRPLKKSDGSPTYFANDIGYHAYKAQHHDIIIDVMGADHGGYIARMDATIAALTNNQTKFEVLLCQIVHILRDGVPLKVSKRAGTFVTVEDLLDQVGCDAIRFTMLTRKSNAQMEFDIDTVIAQTRENPIYYVQYAHARCCSVRTKASLMFGDSILHELENTNLTALKHPAQHAIIQHIAAYPRSVLAAATAREPHRIATYCIELAAQFHALWTLGKTDPDLRFTHEQDPMLTRAHLALVSSVAQTLSCALHIIGITPRTNLT